MIWECDKHLENMSYDRKLLLKVRLRVLYRDREIPSEEIFGLNLKMITEPAAGKASRTFSTEEMAVQRSEAKIISLEQRLEGN